MMKRNSERGNIFFMLFGAVALVGVVAAATSTLMRGPLSTVVNVNARAKADTQMQIAAKLAMVRAAQQPGSGDCDSDGNVEPLPAYNANPKPQGGGQLPSSIGASQQDPWGNAYGYCVWDIGTKNADAACAVDTSAPKLELARLKGDYNNNYPVMVIVSAGPDRTFQTECNDWVTTAPGNDPNINNYPTNYVGTLTGQHATGIAGDVIYKPNTSDDIMISFSYDQAAQVAGGLWSLTKTDANSITTDKKLDIQKDANFASTANAKFQGAANFDAGSKLDLGFGGTGADKGGLFFLPDQFSLQTCNAANNGTMRLFKAANHNALEVCDGLATTPAWVPPSSSGISVSQIDDLLDATAGDTAHPNVFLGTNAGALFTSASAGNNNVGVGINSFKNLSASADGNIVIGGNSGNVLSSGNKNILIGSLLEVPAAGTSGYLSIGNMIFATGMNNTGTTASTGNVGIGTASPSVKLEVAGTVQGTQFQFNSSNALAMSGGDITLSYGGTNTLFINGNGLGVGLSPTHKLDVDGDAYASRFVSTFSSASTAPSFTFGGDITTGIAHPTSSTIGFTVGGSERARITSTGLGIGTTTPTVPLDVVGAGVFTTSVTAGTAFQFGSSNGMYNQSGSISFNTGGTPRVYVTSAGLGVGLATPMVSIDAAGAIRPGTMASCDSTNHGAIRYGSGDALEYCSTDDTWYSLVASGGGGGSAGLWTNNTSYISRYNAHFINSSQTLPAALASAGTRFFWYPDKAAFRAGGTSGAQWSDANIGTYSAGLGYETRAQGNYSFAAGYDIGATGNYSFGVGQNLTASGANSIAMGISSVASGVGSFVNGYDAYATNDGSVALGRNVASSGVNSWAFGLGSSAGARPTVSGSRSIGLFMGDQSGVTLAGNNTMALLGGKMLIDASPTLTPAISGTLSMDVNGDVGAAQYCDENGAYCFTAQGLVGGSVGVFEYVSAAGIIRLTSGTVNYSSASYIFGSPQLADDGVVGHRNRLFYHKGTGAFRVGGTSGTQWDSVGNYSNGLGYDTVATGNYSTAIGQKISATGLNSVGFGLGAAAGVAPIVSGTSSYGVFMGDQSAVNFASSNTFGIFGGKMVIDPRNPATQLAARGVLDLGAATDAMVMPVGTSAQKPTGTAAVNGMIRYNTDNGKFEAYQQNAWQDILTSAVVGGAAAPDRGIQFNSGNNFAASAQFVYTSAGNLGLGTANPLYKLDVKGTSNFSDVVGMPGGVGANPGFHFNSVGSADFYGLNIGLGLDTKYNIVAAVNTAGFRVVTGANTTPFAVFSSGSVGVNNVTPYVALDVNGTIRVADGGEACATLVKGSIRYTSVNTLQYCNGTAWTSTASSGTNVIAIDDLSDAITRYASGSMFLGVGTGGASTATNNTSLGADALQNVSSGGDNVAMGTGAARFTTMGQGNTAVGSIALFQNGNGSDNTAIGLQALRNSTGSRNTGVGSGALQSNNANTDSTAIGFNAMNYANSTGAPAATYNTAVGAYALQGSATAANNTGVRNTAIGHSAGLAMSSGSDNTALGYFALNSNAANSGNTAIGNGAIQYANSSTTGSYTQNTAVGLNALRGSVVPANNTGTNNTAVGANALVSNTAGGSNVAFGTNAMGLNTTGGSNLAIGSYSLYYNLTGSGNVAVGVNSLLNTTGYNNLAIGNNTGGTLTSGSTNILLGYNVDVPNATSNNYLNIGNTITGDMSLGTIAINGTGALTLPIGQTGTRPTGVNGMLRYNSTNGKFEGYQAGAWQDILTSAVAGGAAAPDRGIQFNSGNNFAASSNLIYTSSGDFMVSGTYTGVGAPPATGAGTRMFFNTSKAAFRAGAVTGTEWDNPGQYSVAMGSGSIASGGYSVAIGSGNTASGTYSVALGVNSSAGSGYAVAIGQSVNASGNNGFGTGHNTVASGAVSTAMGEGSTASGGYAVAIGAGNVSKGNGSVTLGSALFASGSNSSAFGYGATAMGNYAMALGFGSASGTNPIVSGTSSYGLFMGNQGGVNLAASNTMGLFGGKFVIDPNTPATQLTARGVLDMGAATDAVVMPAGTAAQRPGTPVNGMVRYNSSNGNFEGYQSGSWLPFSSGAGIGVVTAIDDLSDAITTYSSGGNMFLGSGVGTTAAGGGNTALGYNAFSASVNSQQNTAVGFEAMRFAYSSANTVNTQNTAFGYQAMRGSAVAANNSGVQNTAVGSNSMFSITSGYQNTAVGFAALYLNTGGGGNNAIGYYALRANTTGGSNNAMGLQSLWANTTGGNNIGIGTYSLLGNTTGSGNIALGNYALAANITNSNNVAIGQQAIRFNAADYNVAVGSLTMYSNILGAYNVAVGGNAMWSGVGKGANVAVGYYSMYYADSDPTAINSYNTAIGTGSLRGSTTASSNTGVQNTAIGANAMSLVTSGSNNAALGNSAISNIASGSSNVAIGAGTGVTLTTGSRNILFGSAVDVPTAGTSDYLSIGNVIFASGGMGTGTTVGTGYVGIRTGTPRVTMDIAGTDAMMIPAGTLGQRPVASAIANGMIRYNTSSNNFEGYQNGSWLPFSSASATVSAGADRQIIFNSGGLLTGDTGLVFSSQGAVMVSGIYSGTATPPTFGSGTRMYFDPSRAAFRAGRVTGTAWNAANEGIDSTAFGQDAKASGQQSFAQGLQAVASGDQSVSMGSQTVASSQYGVAIGSSGTIASGYGGIAMGWGMSATNTRTLALGGINSVASGLQSIVLGSDLKASGDSSIALGEGVTVGNGTSGSGFGNYSAAMGLGNPAGTIPQVRGTSSFGIFMGDHSGVVFASSNTMGLFGGKMVIDPNAPATQLTARGVLDLGAATDAIVLPAGISSQRPGTAVNGMLRYNSTNGKFEGYQAGAWQDILTGAIAGGAAAPDRGIQFNSGNNFAASANLVYTSSGDLMVGGTYTGTPVAPASGAGSRMFFDPSSGAFRAGVVTGTAWNSANIGAYSAAFGIDNTATGVDSFAAGSGNSATGIDSIALGSGNVAANDSVFAIGRGNHPSGPYGGVLGYNNSTGSGAFFSVAIGQDNNVTGQESYVLGFSNIISGSQNAAVGSYSQISGTGSISLGATASVAGARPVISGNNSVGVFMGDHSGVTFASANTMGVFGGKLVIDPKVPATQLTARGVLDLGAATDAVVMPIGTTAQQPASPTNGMIRYNTTKLAFEGYQNGAWLPFSSGGGTGVVNAIDDLTDAIANYTNLNLYFGSAVGVANTGFYNTAAGILSYQSTGNGNFNTAYGYATLGNNTAGSANTAMGYSALGSVSSGSFNTAVGFNALSANKGGGFNTAFGYGAGNLATGGNSTFLGYNAGSNITTGASNIMIGYNVSAQSITANNQLSIGNLIFASGGFGTGTTAGTGNVGIRTTSPRVTFDITGTDAMMIPAGNNSTDRPSGLNLANGMMRYNSTDKRFEGYQNGSWLPFSSGGGAGIVSAIDDLSDAITQYSSSSMYLGSGVGTTSTGSGNTVAGYNAFSTDKAGKYNTAFGFEAQTNANNSSTATNSFNTSFGAQALRGSGTPSANTGTDNVAMGVYAMYSNSSGSYNVSLGNATLFYNTTGGHNVAVGYNALAANSSGDNAVGIGYQALANNATGRFNTALGSAAAQFNTTGNGNVGIGQNALWQNAANSESTAVGFNAMLNANNTATGVTTYNTAVGAYALQGSTTASANTGTQNTAIGHSALSGNTTGSSNQAFGYQALAKNTTGSSNIAAGYQSMLFNTTGGENIALGTQAIANGDHASRSIALGTGALQTANGQYNIALGYSTLGFLATGDYNVVIGGNNLATNLTAGSYNIGLGHGISFASATGSNQLNIGNLLTGNTATGLAYISSKAAFQVPTGLTSDRPISASTVNGMIRYNTSSNNFEGYQNGAWLPFSSASATAAAATPDRGVQFNSGGAFAAVSTFTYTSAGNLGVKNATPLYPLDVGDNGTQSAYFSKTIGVGVAPATNTDIPLSVQGAFGQSSMFIANGNSYASTINLQQSLGTVGSFYRLEATTSNTRLDASVASLYLGSYTGLIYTSATGAFKVPVGTDAQRPAGALAQNGMMRYSSTGLRFEGYQNGSWLPFSSATPGSVSAAGITTSVQYNSGGVLAADSYFRYDPSTAKLFLLGDGVSGLYTASTTQLIIGTANTTRLTIGASGGVTAADALGVFGGGNTTFDINSGGVAAWRWNLNYGVSDSLFLNRTNGAGNLVFSSAYKVAIGTSSPQASLDVFTTDSILVPRGTTLQRPATGVNGMIRYNSSSNNFEGYQAGSWLPFSSASAGAVAAAGSTKQIQYNSGGVLGANADFEYDPASAKISVHGDGVSGLYTRNSTALNIGTSDTTRIQIAWTGEVQVVSGYLQVFGGGNSQFLINSGGNSEWKFNTDYTSNGGSLNLTRSAGAGDLIFSSSYKIGYGTASPQASFDIAATDAMIVPRGITSARPATGVNGMMRYNATSNNFEGYQNGAWLPFSSGGGASALAIDDLTDAIANYTAGSIYMGSGSGTTGLGANNVAMGYLAMASATGANTDVAIGSMALRNSTLGQSNVAIGYNAMMSNVAKRLSVAVGYNAMQYADDVTSGSNSLNVAVGANALRGSTTPANNTGIANVALGYAAMLNTTSGRNNAMVGYGAGSNITTGSRNVGLGYQAVTNNATGNDNVSIGYGSLLLTSGSSNIGIGSGVGATLTTGSNNLMFGSAVDVPAATTSNFMTIGNLIFASGGFGTGTTVGTGFVGVRTASPRVTFDITGTDAIMIPAGNNSTDRPTGANLANGMIRYNTTNTRFEGYQNGSWLPFSSGGATSNAAGLNTQVQFNSGGALAASSGFVYDPVGQALSFPATGTSIGTTLTTSNPELVLQQTGDTYGATILHMQNRSGMNGALFENTGVDLVDFAFKGSGGYQTNLRSEFRTSAMMNSGNSYEMQFGPATTPSGVFGDYISSISSYEVLMNGAGALMLPSGNTSNRPATGTLDGMIRYNNQLNKFEARENGSWVNMIGGTLPAGAATQIQFNSGGTAFGATPNFTYDANNSVLANAGPNFFGGFNGALNTAVEHNSGYSGTVNAISEGGGDTYGAFHAMVSGAGTSKNVYAMIGIGFSGAGYNFPSGGPASAGTYLPGIGFAGQTDNSLGPGVTLGASINGLVDGTVSVNVLPSALVFHTSQTSAAGLTERMRIGSNGLISFTSTGAVALNSGTTAQRPSAPTNGMLRYNTTLVRFEGYQNGSWLPFSSSSASATAAASPDRSIQFNSGGSLSALSTLVLSSAGFVGIGTSSPQTNIEVAGALRLSGTGTDSFLTPAGTSVPTKINVPVYAPVAFGQVLAIGIPSSAAATTRVISVFDQRASSNPHQPSIGVFDPIENDMIGFSWEGTYSSLGGAGYLKTLGAKIGLRINTTDIMQLTSASGGIVYMPITGAVNVPAGTTAQRPGVGVAANGMIRYNSSSNNFEGYQSGSWLPFSSGGAGASAAGSTTQLQYNSAGAFAGSANLTFNGTDTLSVTGKINVSDRINIAPTASLAAPSGLALSNLTDVSIGSPATGYVLTWNGTNWASAASTGGAATPAGSTTQIQFNSGGALSASSGLVFSSLGSFMVSGTFTGTLATPASGAGSRMFYDPAGAAFRAGYVSGTQWNTANMGTYSAAFGVNNTASGQSSFAVGNATTASGSYSAAMGALTMASGGGSTAMGFSTVAGGFASTAMGSTTVANGMYSTALGYNVSASSDTTVAIGLGAFASRPAVTGIGSLGIFMGAQTSAVQLAATNTMGLFGGKFVIDPNAPATQLTARGVLDLGAATDALVMPIGTNAQRPGTPVNGMVRYNTTNTRFEGYQNGSWLPFSSGGGSAGAIALDDLTDVIVTYTSHNMYLGQASGSGASSVASSNTAVGDSALSGALSGGSNNAFGLYSNGTTSGSNNNSFGTYSLGSNSTGSNNIAFGGSTLYNNTVGGNNTAIGHYALFTNVGMGESTAIGYSAMYNANSAASGVTYNTAVGAYALQGSATASANTGTSNTAIGHSALIASTTGSNNTALGVQSMQNTTVAFANVAIGNQAMSTNVAQSETTALGYQALQRMNSSTTPGYSGNTAIGTYAIQGSGTASANTGTANTAVGNAALNGVSSGGQNTAMGYGTAFKINTGSNNTAMGNGSLYNLTSGNGNIGLGYNAGNTLTTGSSNIIIGLSVDAPAAATTSFMTIGNLIYASGGFGSGTTAGNGFIGIRTGTPRVTFDINATDAIMVPSGTVAQRPTGSNLANGMIRYNTDNTRFEGYQSGSWLPFSSSSGGGGTPAGSNTYIQFNSGGAFGGVTNFVWNNATNALTVTGDINYTGVLTDTSDRRLKTNIVPLTKQGRMLDKLDKLGTYSFAMKSDPNKRIEFGVMAQEMKDVFPELVKTDTSTPENYMSVNYIGLIAPLVQATKELKTENDNLKSQMVAMNAEHEEMKQTLASIQNDVKGMKAYTGYGIGRAGMETWMMLLMGVVFGGGAAAFAFRAGSRRRQE